MSKGLIVVTGASGFIAKHIVLQLLNQGYSVRATVRSPSHEAELRAAMSDHADDPMSVEISGPRSQPNAPAASSA
jgi:dihydroflavonol-4-reductase